MQFNFGTPFEFQRKFQRKKFIQFVYQTNCLEKKFTSFMLTIWLLTCGQCAITILRFGTKWFHNGNLKFVLISEESFLSLLLGEILRKIEILASKSLIIHRWSLLVVGYWLVDYHAGGERMRNVSAIYFPKRKPITFFRPSSNYSKRSWKWIAIKNQVYVSLESQLPVSIFWHYWNKTFLNLKGVTMLQTPWQFQKTGMNSRTEE